MKFLSFLSSLERINPSKGTPQIFPPRNVESLVRGRGFREGAISSRICPRTRNEVQGQKSQHFQQMSESCPQNVLFEKAKRTQTKVEMTPLRNLSLRSLMKVETRLEIARSPRQMSSSTNCDNPFPLGKCHFPVTFKNPASKPHSDLCDLTAKNPGALPTSTRATPSIPQITPCLPPIRENLFNLWTRNLSAGTRQFGCRPKALWSQRYPRRSSVALAKEDGAASQWEVEPRLELRPEIATFPGPTFAFSTEPLYTTFFLL
ncbi:MAG: hypothetical protein JWM04_1487 [Verrucomicrobiales bacterium]|nr:hypothetical protein [Verrucomicrobiales bacterium]